MGRSNKGRGKQMCNSGDKTKKTVAAATGPTGALLKQGTATYAASFDQTNDVMTEYARVLLRPMASKGVRTLTRPMNTIREKPGKKFRSVAPPAVEGGIPVVTEVMNTYNFDNSKNDPVVDAEDWCLTMNVYMKENDNLMRDKQQWKADDGKMVTISGPYLMPGHNFSM